jgi:hypothetical protein
MSAFDALRRDGAAVAQDGATPDKATCCHLHFAARQRRRARLQSAQPSPESPAHAQ